MIIITGITGFLGSNLARKLIRSNSPIIGIINSQKSIDRISDFSDKCKLISLPDLNNFLELKKYALFGIVHAATVYGRDSESREDIYKCNYELPIQILKNTRKFNPKFFINIDTFYNNKISLEKNMNTYIESKKDLIKYLKKFKTNSSFKIFNLILHHIYGPGDSKHKFTSRLINLLNHEDYLDLTPGLQERDFIYITDACEAISQIIANNHKFEGTFIEKDIATGDVITL